MPSKQRIAALGAPGPSLLGTGVDAMGRRVPPDTLARFWGPGLMRWAAPQVPLPQGAEDNSPGWSPS
jgi:hypothetical protein